MGKHDYDDRLNDMSLAAFNNRNNKRKEFLAKSKALEANHTSSHDLLNLRILQFELSKEIEKFKLHE